MTESFFKKPPTSADLPKYRQVLDALMICWREHAKFHADLRHAFNPLGILGTKNEEKLDAAANRIEAELLSETRTALNRLNSEKLWTAEEVVGLIASLRALQEDQFKSTPWLQPHKFQVFKLLPSAIQELEDFMSQLVRSERGFDPRQLASDFESSLLGNGDSLRDIRANYERLKVKYRGSAEVTTFLQTRFNSVLEVMTEVSKGALDALAKKCPQCAEKPKAEAVVCSFCGYRFQQASELEEIETAKRCAQQIAIAAFRQAAGAAIRQMAQVWDLSLATLPEQIKEELVNKARALAASQTSSKEPRQ